MKLFDNIVLNPPYKRTLHLDVLQKSLNYRSTQNGLIVNLSPIRWIQDPLWHLKANTAHQKYSEILNANFNLYPIRGKDASKYFDIDISSDLGIYVFNDKLSAKGYLKKSSFIDSIIEKVLSKIEVSLEEKVEYDKDDGWRVEIKTVQPIINTKDRDDPTARFKCVELLPDRGVECVYYNGRTLHSKDFPDGTHWSDTRAKGGRSEFADRSNRPLPCSIKFADEDTARRFADTYKSLFFKNWLYIVKYDMHIPLFAIPYIEPDKKYSPDDLCKYFGLDNWETFFMTVERKDYRTKEFIQYIDLNG